MNKCENKEMSVEHQVSEYLNKQGTSIMRKRKFYKYTRRCEAEKKECLYAGGKKLMSLNWTCFFCIKALVCGLKLELSLSLYEGGLSQLKMV